MWQQLYAVTKEGALESAQSQHAQAGALRLASVSCGQLWCTLVLGATFVPASDDSVMWSAPCRASFSQGEDRRCLQHLAEYLRDEYMHKRQEQVGVV